MANTAITNRSMSIMWHNGLDTAGGGAGASLQASCSSSLWLRFSIESNHFLLHSFFRLLVRTARHGLRRQQLLPPPPTARFCFIPHPSCSCVPPKQTACVSIACFLPYVAPGVAPRLIAEFCYFYSPCRDLRDSFARNLSMMEMANFSPHSALYVDPHYVP